MRSRRHSWWAIAALLALIVVYGFYPWEWGIMDDGDYVLRLQSAIAKYGLLGGVWHVIGIFFDTDINFAGILRPGFWIYASTLYLLPAGAGYAIRLAMFLTVLGCTLSAYQRFSGQARSRSSTRDAGYLLAGLLSARSLHDGVTLVSLQEFTGVFFASVGLWLFSREKLGLAAVFFLTAMSFKPPFVWLPAFYGLFLLARKRHAQGLAVAGASGLFLLGSIWLARRGVYSGQIYQFGLERIMQSGLSFAKHIGAPVIVWLAAAAATGYRPHLPRISKWTNGQWAAAVCLASGAMYAGLLLPRGITRGFGYYFAPAVFLLTTGGFFALATLNSERSSSRRKTRAQTFAPVAAVAIAIAVTVFSWNKAIMRNTSVRGVTDWALTLKNQSLHLAANAKELPVSLGDIFRIRSHGAWKNQIVPLLEGDKVPPGLDFYIVFTDQGAPNVSAMKNEILRFPSASIYRVSNVDR